MNYLDPDVRISAPGARAPAAAAAAWCMRVRKTETLPAPTTTISARDSASPTPCARTSVLRGGYGIFYDPPRNGVAGTVASGFQGFSQITPWISTYQSDGVTPSTRLSDPYPGTGPDLPIYDSQGLLSFVGQSVQASIQEHSHGALRTKLELRSATANAGEHRPRCQLRRHEGNASLLWRGRANESPARNSRLFARADRRAQSVRDQSVLRDHQIGSAVGPDRSGLSAPACRIPSSPAFPSIRCRWQTRSTTPSSCAPTNACRRGLQFLLTYTLSKSIDDASVQGLTAWLGGSASLQDPNNRSLERGLSQFDSTHVLNITYVYDLPFGRGQLIGSNWNGCVERNPRWLEDQWHLAVRQRPAHRPGPCERDKPAHVRRPAARPDRHPEESQRLNLVPGGPLFRQSRSSGRAAPVRTG